MKKLVSGFSDSILKTNEPMSVQMGTNGLQGKDMQRSNSRIRRSRIKVTRGRG